MKIDSAVLTPSRVTFSHLERVGDAIGSFQLHMMIHERNTFLSPICFFTFKVLMEDE